MGSRATGLALALACLSVAEGTATVWGEVRTVPVHAGRLTDTFDPLAVHVYELNAAPDAVDEPQSLRRHRIAA